MKKSTKKAPTKTAATKKNVKAVATRLGKPRTKILEVLKKSGRGLTRAQITEATGITSGFTSLLGHLDPAAREPQSLAALGFIKIEARDDCTVHSITAAGKTALDKAAN
jgi:hypothetical protein